MARSTLKPVSLLALSVQLTVIWLDEIAVAVSPLGAGGGAPGVVALAAFEYAESPAAFVALTR